MFEPDSMTLSVIVWMVTIAVAVAVAVFGHHAGRRTLRDALVRLGVTSAAALAFALAVVLTLNTQYGWYASWSDVGASFTGQKPEANQKQFGAGRTPEQQANAVRQAHRDDDAADARYRVQRAAFERSLHLHPSADGEWVKINVPGIGLSGKDIGRVMMWLPPSYVAHPDRTYPVIEAFHGIPGGTLDYERVFHLDKALMKAERAHDVREAIIIVPQEMPNGIDTECVDSSTLKMQTWLTKTVPDFVISHLRAQASRESWASLGVSAGGWCASMAGLLTPQRYSGVVSLGGYFTPQFSNWNPFGSKVPEQYDLVRRAHEHPTDQALWVLVSGADKISGASSEAFTKAVRSPNSLTVVDYPHAGHRTSVWESALPDVFDWMGRTLPEFSYNAASASPTSPSSSSPAPKASSATHAPHSSGTSHPAGASHTPGSTTTPRAAVRPSGASHVVPHAVPTMPATSAAPLTPGTWAQPPRRHG